MLSVALLLVLGASVAVAGTARGALQKPVYAPGEQWVYVLDGGLAGLPGANASVGGTFNLGLTGIVEVDVIGPASGPTSGVRTETHASGFVNGTFVTANMTVDVSGTFSSDTTETWEGVDYLPVASNSTTVYAITVKVVLPLTVVANTWLNATTSYASLPDFNLSVGQSARAPFDANLSLAASFTAFGVTRRTQNTTVTEGAWSREVLGLENVTVEAGTFTTYRLNESLGGFPGIAGIAPASGANETAWFSNDVGYYVKRVAYVNGTPVAEMRLKSYAHPAASSGLSLVDIALLGALPIAAALVVLVLLIQRRRRTAPKGSSGVGPVRELPPERRGGTP